MVLIIVNLMLVCELMDCGSSDAVLCPAVAEAEAVAGAALSGGRRLEGELAALRGGQTISCTAAAAEAADLRRQLEQTRCPFFGHLTLQCYPSHQPAA